MNKLIEFLIHRSLLGNIVTVGIIFLGLLQLGQLNREVFPNVNFDIVTVTTVYPGASSQEIEKLVTIPIEREIKSIDGIKKFNSSSIESRSAISITLEENLTSKLTVLSDIKDAVDLAKIDFPTDVEDPIVSEIKSDRIGVIQIALYSKDKTRLPELKLREQADILIDKIEEIEGIATVAQLGYRDREIHVEVLPNKLEAYNLSADSIIQALQTRNLNFPGGKIKDKTKEYVIRIVKEFENIQEIENLIVRSNDFGGIVRIKDVATVKDTFTEKTQIEKADGKEAIILVAQKGKDGDAITIVDNIKNIINDFKKNSIPELGVFTFNDFSFFIRRRLNVLLSNISIGLVLVLICLLFFLGWRIALVVALGLPFAFGITILFMSTFGITINLISMFGLVIVTGMLVDDAIIIGENIYRHIEQGAHPIKAAIIGTQEMVTPVVAAISTTCIAFLPLMFMSGIFGKFIWVMPATIIIALIASILECFFILPAHVADISLSQYTKKLQKKKQIDTTNTNEKRNSIIKSLDIFSEWLHSKELLLINFLKKIYEPILTMALKYRYALVILIFLTFVLAIQLVQRVGFILFPKDGVEQMFIKVESKSGISLKQMDIYLQPIENIIGNLPKNELDSFTSRIGIHQEAPTDPYTKRGKHYGQISIFLTPEKERDRKADKILDFISLKADESKPFFTWQALSNEEYLKVSNTSNLEFYKKPYTKPYKTVDIKTSFLLGGLLKEKEGLFIGFTIDSELIHYNLRSNKIIKKVKIKQEINDSPKMFWTHKNIPFALSYSQRGFLSQVNLDNGDINKIKTYNSNINQIQFIENKQLFLFSTSQGSLEIWNLIQNKLNFKQSITQAPYYNEQKKVFSKKYEDLAPIKDTLYQPTKNCITFITTNAILYDYDLTENKIIKSYKAPFSNIQSFHAVSNQENSFWLSNGSSIAIFNTQNKKITSQFNHHSVIKHIIKNNNKEYFINSFHSVLTLNNNNRLELLSDHPKTYEKMEIKLAGGGPPVGVPVSLEIKGDNFDTMIKIADKVKGLLSNLNGVYDIRDTWEDAEEEFHTIINEQTANLAGVSVQQIARSLQTAFDGNVATSIKKSNEEIDIRVIFPETLRKSLDTLSKVKIQNSFGNLVPITELAYFKKQPGIPIISHEGDKRTIYVQANIDERKTNSTAVNEKVLELLKPIQKKYPSYSIFPGGEFDDTKNSFDSLKNSSIMALLGIGIILVLLFGNLRNPRVIMIAIPLGFIGVAFTFFIHKFFQPNLVFSFLATMGIIGLTGVVVNDSIVLVNFIVKLRNLGMNKMNAIVQGCLTRLRPVLLTTITTVLGLLPTAYGIGGDDPFLRPMALALGWGLFFASFITLIIIPCYYAIWEDRSFVFHHAISKKMKKIEEEI